MKGSLTDHIPSLKETGVQKIDNILSKYDVAKITQPHPLNKVASKRKIGDEELAKIYKIEYTSDVKPDIIADEIIKANKDILDWAEPEYVCQVDFTPNDPYLANQWFLSKISAYAGWDPTDPDENNPWNAYSAKIAGAKDIQTKIGQSIDVMTGVTATDTCGNDITAKIVTVGRYTFDQTGTYDIKYEVTDAIGSHDEVTVKLMVTE